MKRLALLAAISVATIAGCGGGDGSTNLAELLSDVSTGEVVLEAGPYVIDAGFEFSQPLVISGAGRDVTTIEVVAASDVLAGLQFSGARFELRDVAVYQSGSGRVGAMVRVTAPEAVVTDSRFSTGRIGLEIASTGEALIVANEFRDNEWGLVVGERSSVVIDDNVVSGGQTGIVIDAWATATVTNNSVTNTTAEGILLQATGQATLEANRLTGNGSGIAWYEEAGGIAARNTVEANTFGLDVRSTVDVMLRNNTARNNETAIIFSVEATGGRAEDNVCAGNGRDIVLMNMADPVLADNDCLVLDER